MPNSKRVKEATEKSFKKLTTMPPEVLRSEIDRHMDGLVARLLIDSGMFETEEFKNGK
jgi:hypothetical protein